MSIMSKPDERAGEPTNSILVRPLTRIAYGTGGVAGGVISAGLSMFVLLYYSRVLGVQAAVKGRLKLSNTGDTAGIGERDDARQGIPWPQETDDRNYLAGIPALMGMEWWADRTQGAPERTVEVAR